MSIEFFKKVKNEQIIKRIEIKKEDSYNTQNWGLMSKVFATCEKVNPDFKHSFWATKELFQNAVTASGTEGETLIKIYTDEDGKKHLLVANTADNPAVIERILNNGDSEHDQISNTQGVGAKNGMAFWNSDGRGNYVIATHNNKLIEFETAPYDGYCIHATADMKEWPIDPKYRTFVDIEVKESKELELAELLTKEFEEFVGSIAFLRLSGSNVENYELDSGEIKYNNKIYIQKEEEQPKEVSPNPPIVLAPEIYAKKQRKDSEPTLYKQMSSKQITTPDGEIGTITARNFSTNKVRKNAKVKHFWDGDINRQGAYLVMDGFVMSYLGMSAFEKSTHPGYNSLITLIEIERETKGFNLGYASEGFDLVKTTFDLSLKENQLGEDILDVARDVYDYYLLNKNMYLESEIRDKYDDLISKYCKQIGILYGTEVVNKISKSRYDGLMLLSPDGVSKVDEKTGEKTNKRFSLENSDVPLMLVEYKRGAIGSAELDQVFKYMDDFNNRNIPTIIFGSNLTQEGKNHLISRIASDERYGNIRLCLYQDENEPYVQNKDCIDEEEYTRLISSSKLSADCLKDIPNISETMSLFYEDEITKTREIDLLAQGNEMEEILLLNKIRERNRNSGNMKWTVIDNLLQNKDEVKEKMLDLYPQLKNSEKEYKIRE